MNLHELIKDIKYPKIWDYAFARYFSSLIGIGCSLILCILLQFEFITQKIANKWKDVVLQESTAELIKEAEFYTNAYVGLAVLFFLVGVIIFVFFNLWWLNPLYRFAILVNSGKKFEEVKVWQEENNGD